MNINDKSSIRNCTSCQLCAAVCPKNAINISLDIDGFYRPYINDSLCVNCGICTKVCYKFEKEIETFDAPKLKSTILYGASAKDSEIIKNTTSGGIADILARQLIREGYKCIGVVYDSTKDIAINKIATTEYELIKFKGSKYIQSFTLPAFKEMIKNCMTEKYAIFGTPCHIYAIDKYLRQRKIREKHILVDLYCHGCPSMNLWKKYIKNIKEKFCNENIDNANFRSKIKGWGNFYIALTATNGKLIYHSNNKNNEFFDLFFSDQILNEACNDCTLRSTLAYTDIRLGDFWGKQYVMNNKGVSAVSLVSENAKTLFQKIAKEVNYQKEDYENFLPWQSWGKVHSPNPILRKKLLDQLRNKDIPLTASINTIYCQLNFKQKIFRYGKKVVHSLPLQVEKCIRWIFYKVH